MHKFLETRSGELLAVSQIAKIRTENKTPYNKPRAFATLIDGDEIQLKAARRSDILRQLSAVLPAAPGWTAIICAELPPDPLHPGKAKVAVSFHPVGAWRVDDGRLMPIIPGYREPTMVAEEIVGLVDPRGVTTEICRDADDQYDGFVGTADDFINRTVQELDGLARDDWRAKNKKAAALKASQTHTATEDDEV